MSRELYGLPFGMTFLFFCSASIAEPISLEWIGTISDSTGSPFGLSVGDNIIMRAMYDSDEKFFSTGNDNEGCTSDEVCPINFGASEGDGWELELGNVTLNSAQSDLEDFPGIVFNNGIVANIEGLVFEFGVNGSPANFAPTEGFDCASPVTQVCNFKGDDGDGNSFEGAFLRDYTENGQSPVTKLPQPPIDLQGN